MQTVALRARSCWVWAAMATVLLTTQIAAASSGVEGLDLHINWWTWDPHAPPMGWFLIDFALFVLGLVYFTATPVSLSFQERHASIKKAIADAAAAHAKASVAQADARQKLAGLEAETRELLETSVRDGEAERAQMVLDADEYAKRMKADTSSLADQELKRARLRLQERAMRAALVRARAMLEADLTAADQTRLLDESIAAMGQEASWRPRPLHVAQAPAKAQATSGGAL